MSPSPKPLTTSDTRDQEAEGLLARLAGRFSGFVERWFPDAFVFALLAGLIVVVAALATGVPGQAVAGSFGGGFWDLIPFTMQMAMVVITGYVIAASPPVARLIERCARVPTSPRGAIAFVAALGMALSFVNWGLGLVFAGLMARAVARRSELGVDYRAAGAAAYLGLGSIWALGLSSSAAQLQANPDSVPAELLSVTGVIPFSETIFTWQSLLLAAVLFTAALVVAYLSAPSRHRTVTAQDLGVDLGDGAPETTDRRQRPGDWLEFSPVLTVLFALLIATWLFQEFARGNPIVVISDLDTYNLLFLAAGMVLHWRPRSFLTAVKRAVPATASILIQFPFYAGIAAVMTKAHDAAGNTLAHHVSEGLVGIATPGTFAVVVGLYSSALGMIVPSGGGKWIVEAPYVMDAANNLHYPLGWTVQIYNAAEMLPNLLNPFWMLPLLGILGLRARHLVGFTAIQFVVLLPLTLGLLWLLGTTLGYHPPLIPAP